MTSFPIWLVVVEIGAPLLLAWNKRRCDQGQNDSGFDDGPAATSRYWERRLHPNHFFSQ
jgi:hypothetical protein